MGAGSFPDAGAGCGDLLSAFSMRGRSRQHTPSPHPSITNLRQNSGDDYFVRPLGWGRRERILDRVLPLLAYWTSRDNAGKDVQGLQDTRSRAITARCSWHIEQQSIPISTAGFLEENRAASPVEPRCRHERILAAPGHRQPSLDGAHAAI